MQKKRSPTESQKIPMSAFCNGFLSQFLGHGCPVPEDELGHPVSAYPHRIHGQQPYALASSVNRLGRPSHSAEEGLDSLPLGFLLLQHFCMVYF